MIESRRPAPFLRPFISQLWTQQGGSIEGPPDARERVLPTGAIHLVLRIGGSQGRAYADGADAAGCDIPADVVGGARDAAFIKQPGRAGASVGAMLRPGAAPLLLGASGAALARRHTSMADLWSSDALAALRESIAASAPADRLTLLEAAFADRLAEARPDPLIAHVTFRLERGVPVRAIAQETGWSQRHLTARFVEAVGLTPKTYQRLARFNAALDCLHAAPATPLADLAAAHDYADQAHLTREFRTIAGLTPGQFRRMSPVQARHVPLSR